MTLVPLGPTPQQFLFARTCRLACFDERSEPRGFFLAMLEVDGYFIAVTEVVSNHRTDFFEIHDS
jgi:hypothetical protein